MTLAHERSESAEDDRARRERSEPRAGEWGWGPTRSVKRTGRLMSLSSHRWTTAAGTTSPRARCPKRGRRSPTRPRTARSSRRSARAIRPSSASRRFSPRCISRSTSRAISRGTRCGTSPSVIGCTPADVEDVVSFYTMFYTRPVGRHVLQVCRTLSCALMGAERVTEELSKTLGHQAGRDRRGGRVHAARGRVPGRLRSRAGRRRERSLARVPEARGRARARRRPARAGARRR